MTSPAKKRFLHIFDRIVLGLICFVATPPRVIVASAIGRVEVMVNESFFS